MKNNMNTFDVTVHMIVKNEDQFVAYALESVLPFVSHVIIYDTGSTDDTVAIIERQLASIKKENPDIDIIFNKLSIKDKSEIKELRQRQLEQTQTDWFFLLDGDEVWPQKQLFKLLRLTKELSVNKLAVVNQTHNCVGDVWHILPPNFGKYQLLGKKGHLNIRLMRRANFQLQGTYPNESYFYQNQPINIQDEYLAYCDVWYLHLSYLIRSSQKEHVFGRRKTIYSKGIEMANNDLPEVMQAINFPKRGCHYEIIAKIYDLMRTFVESK